MPDHTNQSESTNPAKPAGQLRELLRILERKLGMIDDSAAFPWPNAMRWWKSAARKPCL